MAKVDPLEMTFLGKIGKDVVESVVVEGTYLVHLLKSN
jgi:hypothetical protein